MKQLRSNRLGLLCLSFLLCLGVGISAKSIQNLGDVAKATSSTLTIDTNDFNSKSYNDNTGGTKNINGSSYKWVSSNVMLQSKVMQWKKSSGVIYNETALGTKITSIKLTFSSGSFTYGVASTSDGLSNATYSSLTNGTAVNISGGNPFFKIKVGSDTGKSTKLEVTFENGPTITSLDITSPTTSFKSGDTLSLGSPTITATYSNDSSVVITDLADSRLSYKLGDEELDINNLPTLSKSNDNGKKVTITYTDSDGQVASNSYTISVDAGYVTAISITEPADTITLPLSGEYIFKAKVEGNEPDESVTWSIEEEDANSIIDENGNFVADVEPETIHVVATSVGTDENGNQLSAEREVIITGERSLTLDKETLSGWSGDGDIYELNATAHNVGSTATYTWTSTDTNNEIIDLDGEDNFAYVSFKNKGGTATITLTIKEDGYDDLTATCVVTVSQSAVTSIALSESKGSAYIGKTTSFTATVEKVGFATEGLTYTSSNEEVAEITQSDKSFTVKALKEGETTIKVSSIYTSTTYAEYVFTAVEDKVTALSWTNKGSFEIYKGDTLKDFAGYSEWKFTPKWLDTERVDNPVIGSGADDIHLGLYDTSTPIEENAEPLSLDYQFTLSDNDKYLVAFYHGVNSQRNEKIKVINWREVIEKTEYSILTDNFKSAIGNKDGYGMPHNQISWAQCFNYNSDIITKISGTSVYTKVYNSNQQMLRLGTSSGNGSLTFESSSEIKIKSLTIGLTGWNGDSSYSVKISDGDTQSFTISNASNEVTFSTATNKLVIESIDKDRTCISSLVINGLKDTDVSKTDDCLGLESFIDSYMHTDVSFDNNEDTGLCRGESGYYALAKTAFNALNDHQRELFCTNEAYSNEYNRLLAWAKANNESQIDENKFGISTSSSNLINKIDNSSYMTIIVVLSIITLTGVSSILVLRKKKEN